MPLSAYRLDPLSRAERYVRKVFGVTAPAEESEKRPMRPAETLVLQRFRELARRLRTIERR